VDANFTGPNYTIGIEEELMILDAESLELVNAVESLLEGQPPERVKPELMESVLEIATSPQPDAAEAGAELRALRRRVADAAATRGLTIGSAGTHPFAMWEDQRIVGRDRYRDLVSDLRFVARQELGGPTRPVSPRRARRSSAPSRASASRRRTTTGPTTSRRSSSCAPHA
jgi:glutamate---cysteine ligase / carboxylate-amine ligase